MNPAKAKVIVKEFLIGNGLPFTKLTVRTVGFSDLARDKCMFVKVYGWNPNPKWEELKRLAVENGFRVEA